MDTMNWNNELQYIELWTPKASAPALQGTLRYGGCYYFVALRSLTVRITSLAYPSSRMRSGLFSPASKKSKEFISPCIHPAPRGRAVTRVRLKTGCKSGVFIVAA